MGRLRSGVDVSLEAQANEIIRQSLRGVTVYSAKDDILTPWKQGERWRREVFTREGVADASIRKGMFKRVANAAKPELNSRDGHAPPRTMSSSMATFVQEHGSKDSE